MAVQTNRSSRGSVRSPRITLTGIRRWMKLKYLLLFRAKGGAAKVAFGFGIGLAVEMFTLPTFGLAFFLIFPLVYLFRASLAAALIGFVFGKIIYIPMAFFNNMVGGWLVPEHFRDWIDFLPHKLKRMIFLNIKLIVGGMVNGALLGLLFYFPLKGLLEYFTAKRTEKRRIRRAQVQAAAAREGNEV